MHRRKRGPIVVIALFTLLLLGLLFFGQQNLSLTGAAVSDGEQSFGVPDSESPVVPNDSRDEILPVVDLPPNLTPSLPQSSAPVVQSLPASQVGVQADCATWPCACGDNVTASITMTGNLTGCSGDALIVDANNIVIDCAGYTIKGAASLSDLYSGVEVGDWQTYRSGIVVKNCNIRGFGIGIGVALTTGSNVTGNNISNATYAFQLINTTNSRFTGNVVNRSDYGVFTTTTGFLDTSKSGNITIANNSFSNGAYGYYGANGYQNNITNNTLVNFSAGGISNLAALDNSSFNRIDKSEYGFYLPAGFLHNNIISNSSNSGIFDDSGYDVFTENVFINNKYGIFISAGAFSNWSNNNFTNNTNHFYFSDPVAGFNNISSTNLVDSRAVHYYYNQPDVRVNQSHNAGVVYLINSSYSIVENITLVGGNYFGIYVRNSLDVNISHVRDNRSNYSISLYTANFTTIRNTTLQNGIYGLDINYAENTSVNLVHANASTLALNLVDSPLTNVTNSTFSEIRIGGSTLHHFNITANNVTSHGKIFTFLFSLDNQTINASNNTGQIYVIAARNISVYGVNISNNDYGVYFHWVNDSYINTSEFFNNTRSIYVRGSINISFNKNSINNTPGIRGDTSLLEYTNITRFEKNVFKNASLTFTGGNWTIFNNNTVVESGTVTIPYWDVSNFVNITNSTFDNITVTLGGSPLLIATSIFNRSSIEATSSDVIVSRSTIANSSSTGYSDLSSPVLSHNIFLNNGRGAYVGGANVSNNTFIGNDAGIDLYQGDSILFNNSFYNNTDAGVRGSSGNIFSYNYYRNNTRAYSAMGGTNTLRFETVINSTAGVSTNSPEIVGMLFMGSNPSRLGTVWYHSIFANNTYDTNFSESLNGDIFDFINSSYNRSSSKVGSLVKSQLKWYIDVNITNRSNRAPLEGVNVSGYFFNGSLDYSNLTDSNGIARLTLQEQYRQSNINYILTNHTIRAFKGNYTKNSTIVNLRNVTSELGYVNITIALVSCGDVLVDDFVMGSDMVCLQDGLHINTSGLSVEGKGFTLYGRNSGVGLDIYNTTYVDVHQLNIANFTTNIHLFNSNFSNITNSTIWNSTYGVVINNSKDNNIISSQFSNLSYTVIATSPQISNNSFINSSFVLSNSSLLNLAQVYYKWFTDITVNVLGTSAGIQGVTINATSLINSRRDLSKVTGASGQVHLDITESILNNSGIFNVTPHNITAAIVISSVNYLNHTTYNASLYQNGAITLNLSFSCTVPTSGMEITANTEFCPGSYVVEDITFGAGEINLTCVQTTLVAPPETPFESSQFMRETNRDDIGIIGCIFSGYQRALYFYDADRIVLVNNSFISTGLQPVYSGQLPGVDFAISTGSEIYNNNFTSSTMRLTTVRDSILHKNRFVDLESIAVIEIGNTERLKITNNTFDGNSLPLFFSYYAERANETEVYNNTFANSGTDHYYYYGGDNVFASEPDSDYTITNSFNKTLNWSVNITTRGNAYDDYCNKGKDLNADGYADNDSSSSTDDWPYNATISSFITGILADYGPKIQTCITEVQVGGSSSSSSGGGGGGGSSGGDAPAAEAPAAPAAAPAAAASGQKSDKSNGEHVEVVYSAQDAERFLKREVKTVRASAEVVQLVVTLENTGTKEMRLFPEILQDVDDPFFIVTRKTLGGEGSLSDRLSSVAYSKDPITGRLLQATIVNPEQIILQPGEKIDKVIEVKEGLMIPRQIKVQFTTIGGTVFEKELEVADKKVFSGTAVDVDGESNLIDLYAVIVPEELTEKLEEYYASNGNALTGAAVAEPQVLRNEYLLELSFDRIGDATNSIMPAGFSVSRLWSNSDGMTSFTDLYGPYHLKDEQSFIFAQQMKYNGDVYQGKYHIRARIYRGETVLVENDFEVDLN